MNTDKNALYEQWKEEETECCGSKEFEVDELHECAIKTCRDCGEDNLWEFE